MIEFHAEPQSRLPRLDASEYAELRGRLESCLLRLSQLAAQETETTNGTDAASQGFDRITQTPTDDTERRSFPRHSSSCQALLCRIARESALMLHSTEWSLHATALKGQVEEVSMNGIALFTEDSLAKGEKVAIRLICPRQNRQLDCAAEVLRCDWLENRIWRVVCRFREKLTYEDLSDFRHFLVGSSST